MLTLEVDWLQVTTIHGKICMIQAVTCVSFPLKKWLHDRMAATSLSLPAVVTSPTEAARTKYPGGLTRCTALKKMDFSRKVRHETIYIGHIGCRNRRGDFSGYMGWCSQSGE
jgi:hypothetical protein